MDRYYLIKEVFGPTIQGEGRHTGTPCMFVRLAKCNKWNGREESKPKSICNFCDTDFTGGTKMSGRWIIGTLMDSGLKAVVFTGGEPMLQLADGDLVNELLLLKFKVMIETNGSIKAIDDEKFHRAWTTISPKQIYEETYLPPSGADLKFLFPWIHPDIRPENFIKDQRVLNTYIQPIDRGPGRQSHVMAAFNEVIKLIRAGHHTTFLSLQTHKYGGFQ